MPGEPPTEPIVSSPPPPPATPPLPAPLSTNPGPVPPVSAAPGPFAGLRYRFTTGLRPGEIAHIRDDAGQAVLSYRAFASVIGIVAAFVAGIVFVAGLAATAFLYAEKSPLRALLALVLTLAFSFLISRLVPRINVTLYDDGSPALTISQRSQGTWIIATPNGTTLATVRKSPFSFLGRTRWTITHEGRILAEAIEESLPRAILRKLYGKFSRRYETNLRLYLPGIEMGRIVRRGEEVDALELVGDALDRRVAVGLAAVVLGREP